MTGLDTALTREVKAGKTTRKRDAGAQTPAA